MLADGIDKAYILLFRARLYDRCDTQGDVYKRESGFCGCQAVKVDGPWDLLVRKRDDI